MSRLYNFNASLPDGREVPLSPYRGKVMLIVNTASQCGFTPQYAELEALWRNYGGRGLVVLGFPCNQFGRQEPGDAAQIREFCQRNYGVTFPVFGKVDVNGAHALPLFRYLTGAARGVLGTRAVKWNFTKFLVGRDGEVMRRYAPFVKPSRIAPTLETALAARSGRP
jgi:glutathione peroxidase